MYVSAKEGTEVLVGLLPLLWGRSATVGCRAVCMRLRE